MQINLVATQMVVEREHANRLTFTPGAGLDPHVDLALTGTQLRALVQGRASTWQQHLTLTPTSVPPGEAVRSPRGPDLETDDESWDWTACASCAAPQETHRIVEGAEG